VIIAPRENVLCGKHFNVTRAVYSVEETVKRTLVRPEWLLLLLLDGGHGRLCDRICAGMASAN